MTKPEQERRSAGSGEERARRRRAEQLLGGLLPDQTSDDTAEGWGDGGTQTRDEDLRRDVPPHHGS